MKAAAFVFLALVALTSVAGHARPPEPIPASTLSAAAQRAPLRLLDAHAGDCNAETPIGVWLRRLTAPETRRIAWSAGPCELVNSRNPIDSGGGACVQARLTLALKCGTRTSSGIRLAQISRLVTKLVCARLCMVAR
jgi:hypothetical protein